MLWFTLAILFALAAAGCYNLGLYVGRKDVEDQVYIAGVIARTGARYEKGEWL